MPPLHPKAFPPVPLARGAGRKCTSRAPKPKTRAWSEEDGVSERAPPQANLSEVVQSVIEGLCGEAILITRDIGLGRLCQPDGLEFLLERIKQHVFTPIARSDRIISRRTATHGPPSRQQGESMLSYVSRRKRWWVTLQEPDGEIKLSEAMRATSR